MSRATARPELAAHARTAVIVAGLTQLTTVAILVGFGLASRGPLHTGLDALTVGAVYALPALLALLSLYGRQPLLLAAAVLALVQAVFPFSLHSFVVGPLALVYLVAYLALRTGTVTTTAPWLAAAVVCPGLGLAALVVPLLHADPVCYSKRASGEVTYDTAPDDITSGFIPGDSDITAQGCSSDTTVWWEAAAGLTLTTLAVGAGVLLVPGSGRSAPAASAQRGTHP